MKICILNGSPKGDRSVTMQYVKYVMKKFPGHEYHIENISDRIKKIERDEEEFRGIAASAAAADLVIWAFPLYYLLVPAQYKRFIELIHERDAGKAFSGKYAAVITTSIHFFDQTAHQYMHAVCDDLGMKFAGSYSAEMNDLLREPERRRLESFATLVFRTAEKGAPVQKVYAPLVWPQLTYTPGPAPAPVASGNKQILILTDSDKPDSNLGRMIERIRGTFADRAELIRLQDIDIKGGCLGCIQCGYDNTCIYTDGYRKFFEEKVLPADIIILAGTITDRYLSSAWKQFFDRSFYRGHVPSMKGKQVGFLIAGPLQQIQPLRETFTAWAENGGANTRFVTDEATDSGELDALLDQLATGLIQGADEHYVPPPTFYSIGGHKIFRDGIWGRMRIAFQADYRYYCEHGRFDFPQNDYRVRLFNAVIVPLTRMTGFRKKALGDIRNRMIQPFAKILADT